MPIRIDNDLPVKRILEEENIFVMDQKQAEAQDIRPLSIVILNLMPLKEDTELHLLRSLSNTPLQVNITLIFTGSYEPKHVETNHLQQFYATFSDIKTRKFDGLIITGAPVEQIDFKEVEYWSELSEIMDWSVTNVTSTLHICWGAQAGLYHHYGIHKGNLPKKLSGVFKEYTYKKKNPLVRGFDDYFFAPHSRYTGCIEDEILKNEHLEVLAGSLETGSYIIMDDIGKNVFVTGHPEYDVTTLDKEYRRDVLKGLKPELPVNYYPENDPDNRPVKSWRCHANSLYTNWLNYYVYQVTPYEL
jgi:homoserine O-succinyltransferase